MFNLIPLPYKLLGAGVLVAGLFAGHAYRVSAAYDRGYAQAQTDQKNKENAELVAANDKVRKLEATIESNRAAGIEQRAQEKLNYAQQLIGITADFQSGAERLRCPSTTVVTTPAQGTNPSPASGPAAAQGGYLMPGTAAVVQRIARTDYENVQHYNEVVRLYNEMREACNRE